MSIFGDVLRRLANMADGRRQSTTGRYQLGTAAAGSILLRGNGNYDYEVVGEAQCQESLEEICGGRDEDGVDHQCVAVMVNDDGNSYDKNAVAVFIDGKRIGFLPRQVAPEFRRQVLRINPSCASVGCRGVIRGGWDRGDGDIGSFGVWLDVLQPLEIEARQ
jgi:hypothetical protein